MTRVLFFLVITCTVMLFLFTCSVVSDSETPVTAAHQAFPVLHHLPDFTQTHVHRVSDAIQPSHPLLSPSPPAFNLFQPQGLFQLVSSLNQAPKDRSFSFSISPSNEYSGLIPFRMDWSDLLAVQGTLKKSSPTSRFKRIHSSAPTLYGPTLTSIHDYWENHSFD